MKLENLSSQDWRQILFIALFITVVIAGMNFGGANFN